MSSYLLCKHEQPGTGLGLRTLQSILLAGALLSAIGLNISCGGGSSSATAPPPSPPPPTSGSVVGTVRDAISGQAISGATVTDGTTTTTTAPDGTYALTVTPSNRKQITVNAANYGDTQRIAPVMGGKSNQVDVALLPAMVTEISDLATDTTIVVPSSPAQVALPANALVTPGGGAPIFPVRACLTPIDPSNNPQLMPGDYTTATGEQLVSFGALDATFTDSTGMPLNLAPDKPATIRIPLASFHVGGTPPPTVPAFYFDIPSGHWVQEGTLTLAGTGMDQYYEGTVGHFTTWNADNVAVTTCITGRVVRADGTTGVAGAVVTATGTSYLGSSSTVSGGDPNNPVPATDGYFQLSVMADQTFTVTASLGYLSTGTPVLTVTNVNQRALNGTFIDTSSWTTGTKWTITAGSPGSATHSSGSTVALSETPIGLVAGTSYTVTYTISGLTAGTVTAGLGGTSGTARNANGTYTETITCGSTNALLAFTPSSSFVGSISNVSVVPNSCQALGNLIIDGKLYLTGTIRDFSPSAPYTLPASLGFTYPTTLTTNGTFASDTAWTKGSGWTISSGKANCGSHSGTSVLSQSVQIASLNGNQGYPVTYTITCTAGTITPILGGTNGTVRSSSGTWTELIYPGTSDTLIQFSASSTFRGSVDTVSVGDGHPPTVTIDADTPFPIYSTTGMVDPILGPYDGPWWNPDFEMSNSWMGAFQGIVLPDLGSNNKPVFSGQAWGSGGVHSAASFNAWWTDFPSPHGTGQSQAYQGLWTIPLTEQLPLAIPPALPIFVYSNTNQFPIDGMYQGNYQWDNIGGMSPSGGTIADRGGQAKGDDGNWHNFSYTFELHISFTYQTGQYFTFFGDDDVYVFINKKLAVDLGGVHTQVSGTVNLDTGAQTYTNSTGGAMPAGWNKTVPLGLTPGQAYQFDFFYCERHTTGSHMQITTTIPLSTSTIPN